MQPHFMTFCLMAVEPFHSDVFPGATRRLKYLCQGITKVNKIYHLEPRNACNKIYSGDTRTSVNFVTGGTRGKARALKPQKKKKSP